MGKYLNGYRRELVLWLLAMGIVFEHNAQFMKGTEEKKWMKSVIISIEHLHELMLKGADKSEIRAIKNAAKKVNPVLFAEKLISEDGPAVSVSQDLIYDLAEEALENCKHDCKHDWDGCTRRKLFLDLLVPAYVEEGPCQYYRG